MCVCVCVCVQNSGKRLLKHIPIGILTRPTPNSVLQTSTTRSIHSRTLRNAENMTTLVKRAVVPTVLFLGVVFLGVVLLEVVFLGVVVLILI